MLYQANLLYRATDLTTYFTKAFIEKSVKTNVANKDACASSLPSVRCSSAIVAAAKSLSRLPQLFGIEVIVVQFHGVHHRVITIVLHFPSGVVPCDDQHGQSARWVEKPPAPAAAWKLRFHTVWDHLLDRFHDIVEL